MFLRFALGGSADAKIAKLATDMKLFPSMPSRTACKSQVSLWAVSHPGCCNDDLLLYWTASTRKRLKQSRRRKTGAEMWGGEISRQQPLVSESFVQVRWDSRWHCYCTAHCYLNRDGGAAVLKALLKLIYFGSSFPTFHLLPINSYQSRQVIKHCNSLNSDITACFQPDWGQFLVPERF